MNEQRKDTRSMPKRIYKLPSMAKLFFRKRLMARGFVLRRKAVYPPATIMIRITHRCDLHCFFCGQHGKYGAYNNASKQLFEDELNTLQWENFIEEVKSFSPYLYFTGGEPLLRDDIIKLIEHASSHGLLSHLNTNGSFLKEKAKNLVKAGLDFIHCSIDCVKPLSEAVTGAKDHYQKAVAGIQQLVDARKESRSRFPIIQVFTTVNKRNQQCLYETAKLAERLRADIFIICFPIFTTPELQKKTTEAMKKRLGTRSKFWKSFIADVSGIDSGLIKRQLKQIKAKRWRFIYRQIPSERHKFDVDTHFFKPGIAHGNKNRCMLPQSLAVILPNGDVATCWDHPDYITGNILKDKFLDIWRGERYIKFREVVGKRIFPSCARCTGLYQ